MLSLYIALHMLWSSNDEEGDFPQGDSKKDKDDSSQEDS